MPVATSPASTKLAEALKSVAMTGAEDNPFKLPSIKAVFPFKDDGLVLEDIEEILDKSGLGFPDYYSWRTRSGCYFCFFQRKAEWVGLLENHPDLFDKSKTYEKTGPNDKKFTWAEKESLNDLEKPERIRQIKDNYEKVKMQLEK